MRIVTWGTYDLGKPRTRILLRGLKENGMELLKCHKNVWKAIEDKSGLSGFSSFLQLLRWLSSYPALLVRYILLPSHEAVFVGYMGHLDVLLLWPFAKMRGTPIVWDAFLSLYSTVVEDRKLLRPENPLAHLLFFFERLSCHAADLILLDTQAHADYFVENFRLPATRVRSVLVGVEPEFFSPKTKHGTKRKSFSGVTVLFYGQLIPLHGLGTILEAARLAKEEDIHWRLIGKGQEEHLLRKACSKKDLPKLEWIPWTPYDRLTEEIQAAILILTSSRSATRSEPKFRVV